MGHYVTIGWLQVVLLLVMTSSPFSGYDIRPKKELHRSLQESPWDCGRVDLQFNTSSWSPGRCILRGSLKLSLGPKGYGCCDFRYLWVLEILIKGMQGMLAFILTEIEEGNESPWSNYRALQAGSRTLRNFSQLPLQAPIDSVWRTMCSLFLLLGAAKGVAFAVSTRMSGDVHRDQTSAGYAKPQVSHSSSTSSTLRPLRTDRAAPFSAVRICGRGLISTQAHKYVTK